MRPFYDLIAVIVITVVAAVVSSFAVPEGVGEEHVLQMLLVGTSLFLVQLLVYGWVRAEKTEAP